MREREKRVGKMAQFEWLSGMNKGMWLGGKERNERERRKRGRREKRGEWERSDEESEDGNYKALEERIRGLMERIGGSEGGLGKSEEKRGNKGSSSEGDDGNKKWRWDGENWWYKVECRAAVNSRLRRRISRFIKATFEQEENRRRDGGDRVRLWSRID